MTDMTPGQQVIDKMKKTNEKSANIIRGAFTMSQAAYYDAAQLEWNGDKLAFGGDHEEATAAAVHALYKPLIAKVYSPSASDEDIEATLRVLTAPDAKQFARGNANIMLGEGGADFVDALYSDKPIDSLTFGQRVNNQAESAMKTIGGVLQEQAVSESELEKALKEADSLIAAHEGYNAGPAMATPQGKIAYLQTVYADPMEELDRAGIVEKA